MARKKKEQEALKQPDEFVSFWMKAGAVISRHRVGVLGGVLGIVALVGVFEAVGYVAAKRAAAATQAFGRIQAVGQAPLATAGSEPAATDFPGTFKTERQRKEAALKEADAYLASGAGKAVQKDGALLLKAGLLLGLDRVPEAQAIYQDLIARSTDPSLWFLAQEGLGNAQEAAGSLDQARATFAALASWADGHGGFRKDQALFAQARLLEKKGDKPGAAKLYREVDEKFPSSPLKEDAKDRLASLEAK